MSKHRVRRHEVVQPLTEAYRLIPLTQGKNAIVDAADFEWLSQWSWSLQFSGTSYYVKGKVGARIMFMHRLILGSSAGNQVDHRNHDTLDNRRCNLRSVTQSQNQQNSRRQRRTKSGYKGVSWNESCHKWHARIGIAGRTRHVGCSTDIKEAARLYDKAALKHFGEHACLNFPDEMGVNDGQYIAGV